MQRGFLIKSIFCAALSPNNVYVGQFILSLVIFFSVFVACVSLKSKQGYSVKENGLITSRKSGIGSGDSTINQLLSITHKIYSAFEEIPSHETRAVFLDLWKAFDRVCHEGLLYKLQKQIDSELF